MSMPEPFEPNWKYQSRDWVSRFLSELNAAGFWVNHFDAKHLHLKTPELLSSELVSFAEIEQVLRQIDIPLSNIDLAKDGVLAPKSIFSAGSYACRNQIWNMHAQGYTIIFRNATRWMPQLRSACEELGAQLYFDVQANVYLTPSGNFSTPPHFDTHHIFVVQVEGSKLWELFECDFTMPRPYDHFDGLGIPVGKQIDAVELRSGSVFYLPRGLAHRPLSLNNSVHVSIGCKRLTMCEAVALICDYVGKIDPRMRAHIPINSGAGDIDTVTLSAQLNLCLEIIGSHHSELGSFLSSQRKPKRV